MRIVRFEDIEAWQKARELTRQVYKCTACGSFAHDFGLRDQIQLAAGSAMHNIAEGFDSGSDIDFIRFLRYAQRSCTEVQSELFVALDQKYITEPQFQTLFDQSRQTRAKIGGFIKYLLSSTKDKSRPRIKDGATKDEVTKDAPWPTKDAALRLTKDEMTKDQGLTDQGPRTR
jgi:four helix bundle protein